jgi:uncharacterized membrane protein YdjX (TVP38/TMEM64 family)
VYRPSRREAAGLALAAAVVAASLLTDPRAALAALVALGDRPVAFAVALVAVAAARPFLGWPTAALSAAVGVALGATVGLPVAMGTVVLTSLPPFLAAGRFAGAGVLGALGDRGSAYFRTAGDVRGVAAARLAPVPADAVSCAAGLSGVGVRAYVAGTLVGEAPWTVAAVLVGASARRLTLAGLGAVGVPLALGAALAAALLLAGPVYRATRGDGAGDAGG